MVKLSLSDLEGGGGGGAAADAAGTAAQAVPTQEGGGGGDALGGTSQMLHQIRDILEQVDSIMKNPLVAQKLGLNPSALGSGGGAIGGSTPDTRGGGEADGGSDAAEETYARILQGVRWVKEVHGKDTTVVEVEQLLINNKDDLMAALQGGGAEG